MQTLAYIRVSGKHQTFDLQRHRIEKMAAARGDVVALREEKASAAYLSRPMLDRIRAEVRQGLVRRLYVFRLDRLTRSGIRDTFELLEEFKQHNCELVTCSDDFDINGPFAEPLIAMMSWAAKMEAHARRERMAAARERMEEQGRAWGRPPRLSPEQVEEAWRMRREDRMTINQSCPNRNMVSSRSSVEEITSSFWTSATLSCSLLT